MLGIRAHDLETPQLANALKEFGFECVQLVCYKAFSFVEYKPSSITKQSVRLIKEQLEGFETTLIGAYFNPVHSDTQKVQRCIEIFKDYLMCAKTLGASTVGSETGSFNDDKWTYNPKNRTDEALETVVNTFQSLCDFAPSGTSVAIEGAAGHICYDVATLKRAADAIDRKNLKIIFDFYNMLEANTAQNYLKILADGLKSFDKIHCFHLKDFTQDFKQCAVGQGIVNFNAVLAQIKEHSPNARLILEGTTGAENIMRATRLISDIWQQL